MKKLIYLFSIVAALGLVSCKKDSGGNKQEDNPRTDVPLELVGAWEHGYIDFALWENYPEGRYAGRDAIPSREAMIFTHDGYARFYRYEFARNMYEKLIDCTGTVAFNDDGTFTFYPIEGRKRYFDSHHNQNSYDRSLTNEELRDPIIAGKRGYVYDDSSEPNVIRITVPGSAPYNWYRKTD